MSAEPSGEAPVRWTGGAVRPYLARMDVRRTRGRVLERVRGRDRGRATVPAPAPEPPVLAPVVADSPTFVDPVAEASFRELGFAVIDLLTPQQAADLLAVCTRLHPARGGDKAWECDFYSDDPECKDTAGRAIHAAMAPGIAAQLVDHETFLHNFVMNWPGPDGGLRLHQHSAVVDETRHRSQVVWCALNPSTEANGTLHVVPRSHRVQLTHKAEQGPAWFDAIEEDLLEHHLHSVPLDPGQALVFDNALLHCSFANRSDEPRITAVATAAPRSADLRYHLWRGDGRLDVYRLEPSFFIDAVAGNGEWAEPEGLELIGSEVASVPWVTSEDVAAFFPSSDSSCAHGSATSAP